MKKAAIEHPKEVKVKAKEAESETALRRAEADAEMEIDHHGNTNHPTAGHG